MSRASSIDSKDIASLRSTSKRKQPPPSLSFHAPPVTKTFPSIKSILSTKSTKSRISHSDSLDSGSSDMSLRRRAHFDQENLNLTYKPSGKEYGYIKITKAATPFSSTHGVQQKLRANMSSLHKEEMRRSIDITLPRPFSSVRLSAPLEMDFESKRKSFNAGEYTLTRQRRPISVHPPLKSIEASLRFQSSCVALTEFFRKHYRQRNSESLD